MKRRGRGARGGGLSEHLADPNDSATASSGGNYCTYQFESKCKPVDRRLAGVHGNQLGQTIECFLYQV